MAAESQPSPASKLQKEFECTVCKGFPKNAMHCKQCQQIICEPCTQHIKRDQSNCPNCRNSPFEVEANQPVRRAVESICVSCEHCGVLVRWAESEDHEMICAQYSGPRCCGASNCQFETSDRRAAFDHIEKVHGLEIWKNFTTITNEISQGLHKSREKFQGLEEQANFLKEENDCLRVKLLQVQKELEQNRQHITDLELIHDESTRENLNSQQSMQEAIASNEQLKTELAQAKEQYSKLDGQFTQFKNFVARRLKPIMEIATDSISVHSTDPTKFLDGFSAEPYHIGELNLIQGPAHVQPSSIESAATAVIPHVHKYGSILPDTAAASEYPSLKITPHSPDLSSVPKLFPRPASGPPSPDVYSASAAAYAREPPANAMQDRSPFEVHGQGHQVYATTEWQFTNSTSTKSIVVEDDMLHYLRTREDTAFRTLMRNAETVEVKPTSRNKGIKYRKLIFTNTQDFEAMIRVLVDTTQDTVKLHVPVALGLNKVESREFYTTLTALMETIISRERHERTDAGVSFFSHPGIMKSHKTNGIVYEKEIYCAMPRMHFERIAEDIQMEMRQLVLRFLPDRFSPVPDFQPFVLSDKESAAINEITQKCKILVYQGEIATLPVDAIVNIADEKLQLNGGVAAAISRAAGPELQQFCTEHVNKSGSIQNGYAVATPAFGELPCLHVIHAVIPRNESNERIFKGLLKLSIKNVIVQASRLKCRSIAMPLISAGIYDGSELGARVLWEALVDLRNEIREGRLEEIHIVDCDQTRVNAIIDSVQSPNFEEKIEYPTHTADLKPPVVLLSSDSSSGHTHSAFLRNSYGSRFMHDMTQDPDDPGFRPRANSSDVCSRVDVSTSNPFAPAQPNPIFDPSLLVLPQPTALDSPLHNN